MVNVIVDTSIIIDHLKKRSLNFKRLVEKELNGELELLIPYIVVTELFAGEDAKNKKGREIILSAIEGEDFIELSLNSAQIAGELMRKYKQIPDPLDLIIAAIAIEQNAYIATANKKHFSQIKEVKIYNL